MKKQLLITSLLLSTASFAQFTQSNEPTIGLTQSMFVVDSFVTNYAGTTGTGVTWDYSGAAGVSGALKDINVVAPSATPEGSNFPTSTAAIEIQGFITSYFSSTATNRNSQGFSFVEPSFGTVNAVFDVNDALLMNYPYAVGNSVNDLIEGYVNSSSTGPTNFDCTGAVQTTVDGSGTLILNSSTSISNVLRYKIKDSLTADVPFVGTVVLKRIQYEYYDLANNRLPVFIHASLDVSIGGAPQNIQLVLSSVEPDEFLGLNSNELTNVTMYPNPAKDLLTIKGLTTSGTATILDLQGKVVKMSPVNTGSSTIAISDLNTGMYVISIETENGFSTQRLVVE